jgi:hypothetical protein
MAVAFGTASLNAQDATMISGKISATYTQQDSIVVGDEMGHLLTLTVSDGENVSTADNAFMDGAKIVNMGYSDLIKGNGTQQGYVKFAAGDDMAFAKWEGKVTTVPDTAGAPVTSFEGTFTYIKGAGKFESIKGSGTFKGGFTSKTEYFAEWQGKYLVKK